MNAERKVASVAIVLIGSGVIFAGERIIRRKPEPVQENSLEIERARQLTQDSSDSGDSGFNFTEKII